MNDEAVQELVALAKSCFNNKDKKYNHQFDELIEFNRGFVSFLDKAYNKGIDLPIFLMYFQKKHNRYIVDKKILYSEVLNMKKTSEEIAEMFRIRCNELGKM